MPARVVTMSRLGNKSAVEVIAGFGEAQLVRTMDGKYELRGGSDEERRRSEDLTRLFFPGIQICQFAAKAR